MAYNNDCCYQDQSSKCCVPDVCCPQSISRGCRQTICTEEAAKCLQQRLKVFEAVTGTQKTIQIGPRTSNRGSLSTKLDREIPKSNQNIPKKPTAQAASSEQLDAKSVNSRGSITVNIREPKPKNSVQSATRNIKMKNEFPSSSSSKKANASPQKNVDIHSTSSAILQKPSQLNSRVDLQASPSKVRNNLSKLEQKRESSANIIDNPNTNRSHSLINKNDSPGTSKKIELPIEVEKSVEPNQLQRSSVSSRASLSNEISPVNMNFKGRKSTEYKELKGMDSCPFSKQNIQDRRDYEDQLRKSTEHNGMDSCPFSKQNIKDREDYEDQVRKSTEHKGMDSCPFSKQNIKDREDSEIQDRKLFCSNEKDFGQQGKNKAVSKSRRSSRYDKFEEEGKKRASRSRSNPNQKTNNANNNNNNNNVNVNVNKNNNPEGMEIVVKIRTALDEFNAEARKNADKNQKHCNAGSNTVDKSGTTSEIEESSDDYRCFKAKTVSKLRKPVIVDELRYSPESRNASPIDENGYESRCARGECGTKSRNISENDESNDELNDQRSISPPKSRNASLSYESSDECRCPYHNRDPEGQRKLLPRFFKSLKDGKKEKKDTSKHKRQTLPEPRSNINKHDVSRSRSQIQSDDFLSPIPQMDNNIQQQQIDNSEPYIYIQGIGKIILEESPTDSPFKNVFNIMRIEPTNATFNTGFDNSDEPSVAQNSVSDGYAPYSPSRGTFIYKNPDRELPEGSSYDTSDQDPGCERCFHKTLNETSTDVFEDDSSWESNRQRRRNSQNNTESSERSRRLPYDSPRDISSNKFDENRKSRRLPYDSSTNVSRSKNSSKEKSKNCLKFCNTIQTPNECCPCTCPFINKRDPDDTDYQTDQANNEDQYSNKQVRRNLEKCYCNRYSDEAMTSSADDVLDEDFYSLHSPSIGSRKPTHPLKKKASDNEFKTIYKCQDNLKGCNNDFDSSDELDTKDRCLLADNPRKKNQNRIQSSKAKIKSLFNNLQKQSSCKNKNQYDDVNENDYGSDENDNTECCNNIDTDNLERKNKKCYMKNRNNHMIKRLTPYHKDGGDLSNRNILLSLSSLQKYPQGGFKCNKREIGFGIKPPAECHTYCCESQNMPICCNDGNNCSCCSYCA